MLVMSGALGWKYAAKGANRHDGHLAFCRDLNSIVRIEFFGPERTSFLSGPATSKHAA
jgi:hypothetical protein